MINAEVERVREVVRCYMDATRRADMSALERCFHRDARVSGCLGDRIITGMPATFPETVPAGEEEHQAQLLSLSVTGRIADAVVYEAPSPGKAGLEHHLQLIEDGGTWRIIAKNFTTV